MRIRIPKVELRLVDEQLYGLGTLGRGDGAEERDRFDLDRLIELVRGIRTVDQHSDLSVYLQSCKLTGKKMSSSGSLSLSKYELPLGPAPFPTIDLIP